jgi:hypothetical protein
VVSGIKMPLLMFATILASAVANTCLAQVLGAKLSFRQVLNAMTLAFAVASLMLGALSPVIWFLASQAPPVGSAGDDIAYRQILLINSSWVGVCGLAGNASLHRLLRQVTGSVRVATRVLTAWLLVAGLAGSELAWLISPFLARPDIAVPLLNPNAFSANIFEYALRALTGARML